MRILQKAGRLRSSSDARGNIWHAVEATTNNIYNGFSLCGTKPGIQWSASEGKKVTCTKCKNLIRKRALMIGDRS